MKEFFQSDKALTTLIKSKGLTEWSELLEYVRKIPYGRNAQRDDFSLVLSEHQGTCSSKHAFLKAVAMENDLQNVQLVLCLYRMTTENTPGIGDSLQNNNMAYIPEAHCYIKYGDEELDVTNENSDLSRIQADILEEVEIAPEQVVTFKVEYHQAYIRDWIKREGLNMNFAEVWSVREACIQNLSDNQ